MDVIPYWTDGPATGLTSADVVGGRFVAPSGDLSGDIGGTMPEDGHPTVAHAGAGVKAIGVAQRDTDNGDTVTIYRTPWIVPVIAGGTVTAGQEVESDVDGKAITLAAGVACGQALSSGALDETIMVALY